MNDEKVLAILKDIRNWVRAASYGSVKTLLETTLPDPKSRAAYQMLDGTTSMEKVRVACKMSPNALLALAQRCTVMGIMEVNDDNNRLRLFDLADFGLIKSDKQPTARANNER
jgi:hypothetical protein